MNPMLIVTVAPARRGWRRRNQWMVRVFAPNHEPLLWSQRLSNRTHAEKVARGTVARPFVLKVYGTQGVARQEIVS